MGKSKRSRRNFRDDPLPKPNTAPNHDVSGSARSIVTDLNSLDEKRRLKACRLLSALYNMNSHNLSTLEKITSPDILSKLCMRLADSSSDVRFEAIGAVRNIAVSKFKIIGQRVLGCGLLEIITSLCIENLTSMSNVPICIQSIECLSNLVSSDEDIASKFSIQSSSLVPLIVATLSRVVSEEAENAVANLLIVITDNFESVCNEILKCNGVEVLLQRGLFVADPQFAPMTIVSSSICLKCLSAVVNICSCVMSRAPDLVGSCRLGLIAEIASNMLKCDGPVFAEISAALTIGAASSPVVGGDLPNPDAAFAADVPSQQSTLPFEFFKLAAELLANLGCIVHDEVTSVMEKAAASTTSAAPASAVAMAPGGDDDVDETGYTEVDMSGSAEQSAAALLGHGGCPQLVDLASVMEDMRILGSVAQSVNALMAVVAPLAQTSPLPEVLVDILECLHRLLTCAGNLIPSVSPAALLAPSSSTAVDGTLGASIVCKDLFSLFAQVLESQNNLLGQMATASSTSAAAAASAEAGEEEGGSVAMAGGVDVGADDEGIKMGGGESSAEEVEGGDGGGGDGASEADPAAVARASVQVAAACAECLAALCRHAPVVALQHLSDTVSAVGGAVVPALGAAAPGIIQPLSLLLCKGVTSPDSTIAIPCIEAMSALGSKDGEAEASLTLPHSIVSPRINAILTNSLIRRIEDSVSTGTTESLLIADSCFGAVIDLHSSDDSEFLKNFVKLNMVARLTATFQACKQGFASINRSSPGALDSDEKDKIKETLVNVKRFIQYKQSFLA